jgi:hypothetical protein
MKRGLPIAAVTGEPKAYKSPGIANIRMKSMVGQTISIERSSPSIHIK